MIQQFYAQIKKKSGQHAVLELCRIYGVSRSGYYKWLHREGSQNRYEKQWKILDTYVQNMHAHHPMLGYRSIRDLLILEYGYRVSDPSVLRSMQRLQIHGYLRKNKRKHTASGLLHARYPDHLKRNFSASAPLQKVVTDVTYLKHKGKWHYLAAYMDLYNNEILEWELSDVFDNPLVMRPALRLLEKTKSTAAPILLHSDQGVQYSSAGYCGLLSKYSVIQSMSRAGMPRDNAVMESFWGRFKDTLRKQFRYFEKDDLAAVVADCIHYFNYSRPLRKLNGKPPIPFRLESAVSTPFSVY